MLLIYEGPDGAGKDTLRKAFDRETNYVHTCVVRMFLSNIVYARYYHRKLPIGYLTMVRKFMHDYVPLIVLVIAEPKVLNARVMMRGENLASTPLPNKIIQFYSEAIGLVGMKQRTVIINTTMDPRMKILVHLINRKIKELED